MREGFKQKFRESLSLDGFKKIFKMDNENRFCCYCGISESEIDKAIQKDIIKTKRLYIRGRTMEVERHEPNGGYSVGNIGLCCYWCNNAKTDEFSVKEFEPIKEEIKNIWRNRGIELHQV